MDEVRNLTCQNCYNVGARDGDDGFFYCLRCGERCEDVIDTAVDDDDLFNKGGATGAIYMPSHQRQRPTAIKAEPISQYDSFYDSQSNFIKSEADIVKVKKEEDIDMDQFRGETPTEPADFAKRKVASFEDYHNEIMMRYVMGLQMMIELQCEALVKEFKVTPLVCGLVGSIWLRFVSKTGVFDEDWAEKVIHDSEMQEEGEAEDHMPRSKHRAEPHNMFGRRAVMIWFRTLRNRIPLSCTVAISYLACHIAREAVLPSDIMKWTCEGKLPYFSAFVEIESRMGPPSIACPISSSVMFKPQRAVPVRKLELFASSIAQFIGLELPPVNFYAIAYRYLEKLSLPVEKILPYSCRIYEWSMPPDLWLSLSKDCFKLPTHVCVVSILVVAIRILYNINGLGEWEKSLSHIDGAKGNGDMGNPFASRGEHDFGKDSAKDPVGHKLDSAWLLQHLQTRYITDSCEYSEDLPTYLKYCRDVVFAGSEPSYGNHEEEKMIEHLWNFYQNKETSKPSQTEEQSNASFYRTKSRDKGRNRGTSKEENMTKECFHETNDLSGSIGNDHSSESLPHSKDSDEYEHSSGKPSVKEAIRKMKLDMEENRFCYIPPRVERKRLDYLHYSRKRDEGALTYVAHADYYILLRAFARVAQVDIRILDIGVLSLETRLAWLEKRIDHCFHSKPPKKNCQFCSVMASEIESGLSNLNI